MRICHNKAHERWKSTVFNLNIFNERRQHGNKKRKCSACLGTAHQNLNLGRHITWSRNLFDSQLNDQTSKRDSKWLEIQNSFSQRVPRTWVPKLVGTVWIKARHPDLTDLITQQCNYGGRNGSGTACKDPNNQNCSHDRCNGCTNASCMLEYLSLSLFFIKWYLRVQCVNVQSVLIKSSHTPGINAASIYV